VVEEAPPQTSRRVALEPGSFLTPRFCSTRGEVVMKKQCLHSVQGSEEGGTGRLECQGTRKEEDCQGQGQRLGG
jgi:hypothetical protein